MQPCTQGQTQNGICEKIGAQEFGNLTQAPRGCEAPKCKSQSTHTLLRTEMCTQDHPISHVIRGHPCPGLPGVRSTDGQEPATPQPLCRRVQEGPHSPGSDGEPWGWTGFVCQPKLWAWARDELGEEEQGRSLLEARTMVDDSFCARRPDQALGWLPVARVPLYIKGNTSPSTTPGPPQGEGSAMGPPSSPDASTEPQSNGTQEVHSTAAQALTLRDLQEPSPNRDAFDPRRLHQQSERHSSSCAAQDALRNKSLRLCLFSRKIRGGQTPNPNLLCSAGAYTQCPQPRLLEISGWRCWIFNEGLLSPKS